MDEVKRRIEQDPGPGVRYVVNNFRLTPTCCVCDYYTNRNRCWYRGRQHETPAGIAALRGPPLPFPSNPSPNITGLEIFCHVTRARRGANTGRRGGGLFESRLCFSSCLRRAFQTFVQSAALVNCHQIPYQLFYFFLGSSTTRFTISGRVDRGESPVLRRSGVILTFLML